MENASKALIIAGAILLAILIVSLGITIFNNAKDNANNQKLDEQVISAFNSKFASFEGTKTGTEVNTMLQQVIASNQAEKRAGTLHYVEVNGNAAKITPGETPAAGDTTRVNPGNSYNVTIQYGDNGLVSIITVN